MQRFAPVMLLLALLAPVHHAVAASPQAGSCTQALGAAAGPLEAAAQQAFQERHFAAAYGRYARLADAGHAPSAEIALFMLLNGRGLFASDWTATEKQQACWNALLVARARQRVALNVNLAGD